MESFLVGNPGILEISLVPVSDDVIADLQYTMAELGKSVESLLRIVDVKVTLDGQRITTFDQPITISFDVSGLVESDLEFSLLSGFRLEPGNGYSFLGGRLENGILSFQTDRLSTFGLMTNIEIASMHFSGMLIENNHVFVPIRAIAEGLGGYVDWNHNTRTVYVSLDDEIFTLTIGEIDHGLAFPPRIVRNRTLIHLDFVSDVLGANVVWDGSEKTIYIVRGQYRFAL